MDGIMPLRGSSSSTSFAPSSSPGHGPGAELAAGRQGATAVTFGHPAHAAPAFNPAAAKGPADYLRAVKRRIWLVLVVAVPMAALTSAWALRQPKIYRAVAEITIDPPQINPMLSTLVSRDLGQQDGASQERYAPNRVAHLQSLELAEQAVTAALSAKELAGFDDAAQELFGANLVVKPVGKTNRYIVTLEGRDPARTSKLLFALVEAFRNAARKERQDRVGEAATFAEDQLSQLKRELTKLDDTIIERLRESRIIGPSGRNIFEEQYINISSRLANEEARVGELQQQFMIARSFPRQEDKSPAAQARDHEIAQLMAEKKKLVRTLENARRIETHKQFNSDPFVKNCARLLKEVMDEIEDLQQPIRKTEMAGDPTRVLLDHFRGQVEDDRASQQEALARMQDSLPEHQKFQSMQKRRDELNAKVTEMEGNLLSFAILTRSQNAPVTIPASVAEPTIPVKPSRGLLIGMGMAFSLVLGMGLVVLLEHVDHCVKVPEHVTQGLTLPLLGVVPRIRRSALTHRGGHLWTSSTPNSLEADAFRNVRASLLGAADRHGNIVTLLVTSPKAGDGKSTAALNLAATCARAGERTLLLDVDLRRPTLEDVFPPEPGKEGTHLGLVDVLQGTLPWQKTLRHTELPNLDFIPTGDPTGIPIEILGTLELRQLLAALSRHYDRVILDGPAVLGMADCRMLGRMVDASILVVRAGAHPLVTLQRTKTMLELSHVAIAGVVVNGLSEGVEHWSSYGYDDAGFAPARAERERGPARALAASAS
ncbi:GumC family protein [Aquisphaera insulae]|uniref:GumC family protein n=1 Tax=Aquisphaera insulae TaxID=2712864 RepID=UPI0013EA0CC3|nr:polysaccharide biosynthesis tyrosine autokinase [Aquisphaera insulae]